MLVTLEFVCVQVSKLGFGCMGLSGIYNSPLSNEDGLTIIKDAYSKRITFFDTADAYGANANEVLVKKVQYYSRKSVVFL